MHRLSQNLKGAIKDDLLSLPFASVCRKLWPQAGSLLGLKMAACNNSVEMLLCPRLVGKKVIKRVRATSSV